VLREIYSIQYAEAPETLKEHSHIITLPIQTITAVLGLFWPHFLNGQFIVVDGLATASENTYCIEAHNVEYHSL
jgi:hypothetical protein